MKNLKVVKARVVGLLAILFLLTGISLSYAGVVDDVLPIDKDKVLTPTIGKKPKYGQIVPKPESIIIKPYSDRESEQIRRDWHEALGVDIWRPYYMLQDFENMLRNHLRIKLGPFIGRPYFNYKLKEIEYRFTWRF